MHGSFILARNSVEQRTGFDFGPSGSITEDAWWSLVLVEHGYGVRWVDGFVLEQAPQSAIDFIKQRRRWFLGLWLVVTKARVPMRRKALLGLSVLLWSTSAIALAYTYLDLLDAQVLPTPSRLIGDLGMAIYVVHYLIGLRVNLNDRRVHGLRRCAYYGLQVVALPLFSLLEVSAIVYGALRPDLRGFHVIRKDAGSKIAEIAPEMVA